MNHRATHNSNVLNRSILTGLNVILLGILGIQIVPVLIPVHNCAKRFKL